MIVITCLTGAVMVFQDEIEQLCFPKRYTVSGYEGRTPLPFSELVPVVNAQLTDNEVASIQIYPDPGRTYRMGLKNGRRVTAFVDPYTGEVIAVSEFTKSFFGKIMFLHRWLMLEGKARETGKLVVGVSTVFFVFILVSGIVIWLPRSRKQLKNAFSFKLKGNKRTLWYNVHRVLGIYAALLLLMLALTGLMWSFEWYRGGVTNLIAGKEQPPKNAAPRLAGDERSANRSRIQSNGEKQNEEKNVDYSVWEKSLASLPADYRYRYARVDERAVSALPRSAWHDRAIDRFSYDPATGVITKYEPYSAQPARSKVMAVNHSLHMGRFGGIGVKILLFFASLIGALLPITGYWLWWSRVKAKNKKRK